MMLRSHCWLKLWHTSCLSSFFLVANVDRDGPFFWVYDEPFADLLRRVLALFATGIGAVVMVIVPFAVLMASRD